MNDIAKCILENELSFALIFRFACWYDIIFLLLVGGQYNVKERQQLIFKTLDSTDFVVANGV